MLTGFKTRILSAIAAALLALSGAAGTGMAQDAASQPAATSAIPVADQVREFLAKRFGVAAAALANEADLVNDLHLDQTDVYYAVIELFEMNNIKKPQRELTKVADIIAAIEMVKSLPNVKKRSVAAAVAATAYVQTVFYATDRKATGNTAPVSFFSGERAENGQISYGRAEVNIPYSHKPGQIETPWLQLNQLRDATKHIFVLKLDAKDETAFFSEVTGLAGGADDILVYIHGFNVTFENALQRAAQISFDFGFKGTPVVFSWPSYAGVTGYNTDWENVNWATKHIETFLTALTTKAKGRKIHIIAHSMGNKGLLNALRLMTYRGAKAPLFQSVILCAPDFDAGMFREQVAAEIKPLAKQWVVYSSKKDIALMTSEKVNTPRLGTPTTYAEGYEIIDASEIEVTPWSVPETHSYYAAKKVVLDDMVKVLAGIKASARGLKTKTVGANTVWAIE
jgi:esterase/lipase superfamily enzyme